MTEQKELPQMDWQQVLLNGGPPCFFVEGPQFCGRAERWQGHGNPAFHDYVPLEQYVQGLTRAQPAEDERVKEIREWVSKQSQIIGTDREEEAVGKVRDLLSLLPVQPAQVEKLLREVCFRYRQAAPWLGELSKREDGAYKLLGQLEEAVAAAEKVCPIYPVQPAASTPTERQMPDTPSGRAWRDWFDRVGEHATVDVVNATATLVIRERDHAAASTEAKRSDSGNHVKS